MASFPNRRRNEMISGTMARPAEVRPLSGDVLIDPEMEPSAPQSTQRMRELQRLSGRGSAYSMPPVDVVAPAVPASADPFPIQRKLAENDRIVAGIQADQAQRDREHELYPIRQQLPQFHGKMYAAPLDGATEQRLADMRQPISNGSPDFDPNSARMQNLRAAAERYPISTQSTPLPASQDLLEEIKQRRLAEEAATAERRSRMSSDELNRLDQQAIQTEAIGNAVNKRGLAMQQQNAKANANVTNNAQAQRLTREQAAAGFPISPLQSTAAVQSGLYGVRAPMPDETARPQTDPMNSVGFAVNFPQQYAINQQAQTSRAATDAQAKATEWERQKEVLQLQQQAATLQIAELERQKQGASAERKIELERQQQAIRQQVVSQALAAHGAQGTSGGAPASASNNGMFPITPISSSSSVAAPTNTSAGPSQYRGGFPVATTQEQIAMANAGFKPTFPDLGAADPWNDAGVIKALSSDYRPSQQLDGTNFATDSEQQFYHGQQQAKRILDEMLNDVRGQNLITGPDSGPIYYPRAYEYLKNKYAGRYGADAVRWAMARLANKPEWIHNVNKWNSFLNPSSNSADHDPFASFGSY